MKINYGKAIIGAIIFGILIFIINTTYINLDTINSLFTKQIPIGTILLVIFGIIVMDHIRRVFKFYKVCAYNKYVVGIVLNVCIYLIMLSIVLSIHIDFNNADGIENIEKSLNNISSSIKNNQNTSVTPISPLEQLKINERNAAIDKINSKYNLQSENKEPNTKQCIKNAEYELNAMKIKSPIDLSYSKEDTQIFDSKNEIINYIKTYNTMGYSGKDIPEIYAPFVAIRYNIEYPDGINIMGIVVYKESWVYVCNSKGDHI